MPDKTPPKLGRETGPGETGPGELGPGELGPAESDTSRRLEIEQARRTRPVQAVRSQLRTFGDKDEGLRLLAEGIRRLLHQK